ncbi:MAG TPA: hypothetical protein VF157_00215 [Chloroflexota bacterium]
MTANKTWIITAGVALWLPLMLSFLGAMSVARLPGAAATQLPMVILLVAASVLLGLLIGRTADCRRP